MRLVSYSKYEVKTIGRTHVVFEYRKKYHDALVHVVDYDVVPVLGVHTSLDMNLVKRINVVDENRSTPSTDCVIKIYISNILIYNILV